MKKAQKYEKKKPFVFSVAHSDMYFPLAVCDEPYPNPFMKDTIKITIEVKTDEKYQLVLLGCSCLNAGISKLTIKGMLMVAPQAIVFTSPILYIILTATKDPTTCPKASIAFE